MKYAVIQSGGKQYKVKEGDVIDVDQLPALKDQAVTFEKVLLYVADNPTTLAVGKPHLLGASVTAKVLGQKKGEKIRVSQFKAKARRRRVVGHRASMTQVQIASIVYVQTKEPLKQATTTQKNAARSKTSRAKKA